METLSYSDFSSKFQSRVSGQRIPVNGVIEVTRRCPLKCAHCYNNLPIGNHTAKLNEVTYQEHCRMIDEIAEAGCLWLLYTGGEIFVRKDFIHAMLLSGESLTNPEMTRLGLVSLEWLVTLQHSDTDGNHFVPIGSNGFYHQGGERARFDQQPVQAQAMISACLAAYRLTGKNNWHIEARHVFEWFLGRNDLHLPVYDPTTGGCRDGLHPDRPNENQGAESTLAFLQSLLELRLAENIILEDEDTHIDLPTVPALSTSRA